MLIYKVFDPLVNIGCKMVAQWQDAPTGDIMGVETLQAAGQVMGS